MATAAAPPPLAVRPSLSGARLKAYILCLEAHEFDRACAIAVKLRPSALAKPLREAARCEEAYLKLTDTSPGPRLGFVQLHLKQRYAASITDLQSCAVALRGRLQLLALATPRRRTPPVSPLVGGRPPPLSPISPASVGSAGSGGENPPTVPEPVPEEEEDDEGAAAAIGRWFGGLFQRVVTCMGCAPSEPDLFGASRPLASSFRASGEWDAEASTRGGPDSSVHGGFGGGSRFSADELAALEQLVEVMRVRQAMAEVYAALRQTAAAALDEGLQRQAAIVGGCAQRVGDIGAPLLLGLRAALLWELGAVEALLRAQLSVSSLQLREGLIDLAIGLAHLQQLNSTDEARAARREEALDALRLADASLAAASAVTDSRKRSLPPPPAPLHACLSAWAHALLAKSALYFHRVLAASPVAMSPPVISAQPSPANPSTPLNTPSPRTENDPAWANPPPAVEELPSSPKWTNTHEAVRDYHRAKEDGGGGGAAGGDGGGDGGGGKGAATTIPYVTSDNDLQLRLPALGREALLHPEIGTASDLARPGGFRRAHVKANTQEGSRSHEYAQVPLVARCSAGRQGGEFDLASGSAPGSRDETLGELGEVAGGGGGGGGGGGCGALELHAAVPPADHRVAVASFVHRTGTATVALALRAGGLCVCRAPGGGVYTCSRSEAIAPPATPTSGGPTELLYCHPPAAAAAPWWPPVWAAVEKAIGSRWGALQTLETVIHEAVPPSADAAPPAAGAPPPPGHALWLVQIDARVTLVVAIPGERAAHDVAVQRFLSQLGRELRLDECRRFVADDGKADTRWSGLTTMVAGMFASFSAIHSPKSREKPSA